MGSQASIASQPVSVTSAGGDAGSAGLLKQGATVWSALPDGFVDPGVHVDSIDEFQRSMKKRITNVQEGGGYCSVGSMAMDVATVGLTRLANMDLTFHHWLILEIDHGNRYCSIAFFGNNKREFLFDETPELMHDRSFRVVKTSVQDSRKTWEWWGPPAQRLKFEDVYRFCEAYIRNYGRYFWGSGNDPMANSCQSFCRNFEAKYHEGTIGNKK